MPAKGWKKESPREHVVKIRLNDEELQKLEQISQKLQISYSEFLRKRIEVMHQTLIK